MTHMTDKTELPFIILLKMVSCTMTLGAFFQSKSTDDSGVVLRPCREGVFYRPKVVQINLHSLGFSEE